MKELHVKHTNNSKKAGERVYNESLQPWQHNLIKTSNGMVGLFNDLKIKYDEPNDEVGSSFSIPTTKFNQALLKISISGCGKKFEFFPLVYSCNKITMIQIQISRQN